MKNLLDIFSVNDNDNIIEKIPRDFKIAAISTFVFGLCAHLFMFANPIFGHDASNLYWASQSFTDAAAQARWLVPFWHGLLTNVYQPWLCGVLTLIVYSFVSYFICKYFNITRTLAIALISGIMVTAPTATSSNLYLSSAYIYALALLFAVLSAYCYKKFRYGWILSVLFMFLCGGTYTAYVSFAVTLFICHSVINIINGRYSNFVSTLLTHISFVAVTLSGLFANVAVIVFFGGHSSVRGVSLTGSESTGFVGKIINVYKHTIGTFGAKNHISYMAESRLFYFAFVCAVIATAAAAGLLIFKNKVYKKLTIAVLAADLICLPLAMDVIGVLYESHLLMHAAFIAPWIVIVVIYEEICRDADILANVKVCCKKAAAGTVYAVIVLVFSFFSIGHRTVLANVCYTKAFANYQAGIATATRIANFIEDAEGYVPGQTKVVFVGNIEGNNHNHAYSLSDSVTGIGSDFYDGYWDTAIPAAFSLKAFIQQHLGYKIEILNETYFTSIYGIKSYADERPNAIEYDSLWDEYDKLQNFPDENCYVIYKDVMLFRLS